MRDGETGDVRRLDDVRALAALANGDRSRLMDALAVHGPSTTSALAQVLGLATGSVSHHIKVLVEAGLVERDPEEPADRRKRHWRLVTRGWRWDAAQFRGDPAAETVATTADAVVLAREYERAREFLESAEEPWDEAAHGAHVWLRASPEELSELGAELDALLLRWRRREIPDDGADRRPVLAFVRAFPSNP